MKTERNENVKCDCFAYKNDGNREKCTALKSLYCKYGECNFYKTKADLRKTCKKATGRTRSCAECVLF